MNYLERITFDNDKRSGKPCIRNLRITVYDILDYLASGMNIEGTLDDFPELTKEDVLASLSFAADREKKSLILHA